MGVDIAKLPLKVGLFGAEPWSMEMRGEIEERMGLTAYDIYGLTEMMGPGVSFDCEAHDGWLHVNEDHIMAEIIDPVTEEVLPWAKRASWSSPPSSAGPCRFCATAPGTSPSSSGRNVPAAAP
jgi:phenylacetate-CoA ligase